MTEIACVFAIFHEVAHVIAGHAGYLRERQKISLLELYPLSTKLSFTRLLRVWEYEADKIASVMLLSFLVGEENQAYLTEVFQMPKESAEHRISRLTSIGVAAAYVLFLLLGQRSAAFKLTGSHPHPLVRMTMVHNAMRLAARDDLGVKAKVLDHYTDQVTTEVYKTWEQLGVPVPVLSRRSLLPAQFVVRRQIENFSQSI